jgi:hypothetical protein
LRELDKRQERQERQELDKWEERQELDKRQERQELDKWEKRLELDTWLEEQHRTWKDQPTIGSVKPFRIGRPAGKMPVPKQID